MAALNLPAAEYMITLNDGSTTTITVDPGENLEEVIAEYLEARGADIDTVASVELVRAFDREERRT
jgi:hypothetical protein